MMALVVVYDTVLRYFDHEEAVEENMEENVHACKGEECQEELRAQKERNNEECVQICLSNGK